MFYVWFELKKIQDLHQIILKKKMKKNVAELKDRSNKNFIWCFFHHGPLSTGEKICYPATAYILDYFIFCFFQTKKNDSSFSSAMCKP